MIYMMTVILIVIVIVIFTIAIVSSVINFIVAVSEMFHFFKKLAIWRGRGKGGIEKEIPLWCRCPRRMSRNENSEKKRSRHKRK